LRGDFAIGGAKIVKHLCRWTLAVFGVEARVHVVDVFLLSLKFPCGRFVVSHRIQTAQHDMLPRRDMRQDILDGPVAIRAGGRPLVLAQRRQHLFQFGVFAVHRSEQFGLVHQFLRS
jgi:hypothetical protein